jgi:hypothetical protein
MEILVLRDSAKQRPPPGSVFSGRRIGQAKGGYGSWMRRRFDFSLAFVLGDYVAGALIGLLTAGAVHLLIRPTMDTVLAMMLGTVLGVVVHLVIGLLLTPLLGAFHTMIPGSLIGMYGGMLFAMRETMQHPTSLKHAAQIGVVFGIVVVAAVQLYNRALRTEPSPGR